MTNKISQTAIITSIILGLVLIFSGIAKMLDTASLISLLNEINILPQYLIKHFVALVIITEIFVGGMLLFKRNKFIINLQFLIYISFFIISAVGVIFNLQNDCGCFGGLIESSFNGWMILRNSIFLILSFLLFKNKVSYEKNN